MPELPRDLSKLAPVLRPGVVLVALLILVVWGLRFVTVLPPGYDMPLAGWLTIWWPVGALVTVAASIGAGRLGWGLIRRVRDGAAPSPEPAPQLELRWSQLDTVLLLACMGLGAAVVVHFCQAVNPEGAVVGMDAPSYLENILVVAQGNWARYNTDKYILHARLGAWLGPLFGGDYPAAARFLAAACIASLPPLTYLAGRAAFGRVVSLLAACWLVLDPLLWTYAVQTTNYALFAAVVAMTAAATGWVLARPRWWTWSLLGVTTALCASTQEKAPLILGPIWVVLLAAQAWRRPARAWQGPALALGAALALVLLLDPPVRYTAFGSLVVNQREELNQEMPGWTWDEVERMDPDRPTPISPWLPEALRRGALEATVASLLAPPNADVLRLFKPDEHHEGRYVVEPHTSIPPLSFRLRFNSVGLRGTFGDRLPAQLGLLLGLAALVLPTPRSMEQRRLPALMLLLVLPSLFGPLSFKYHPRYLIHAFPVLALLCTGGLARLAHALVGGRSRPWRAVALGLTTAVGLAWLAGLYLHRPSAWVQPTQALVLAPLERAPEDLGADDFALSMARAARWLEDRPEATIHDCGPVMMWLSRPWDDRFQSITTEACRAVLDQQRPPGELLIVSDRNEYRAQGTLLHSDVIKTGRWELLAAWSPAPVDPGRSVYALRDQVAVYRSR